MLHPRENRKLLRRPVRTNLPWYLPYLPILLATRPGNNLDSAATTEPYLFANATFLATWQLAPGTTSPRRCRQQLGPEGTLFRQCLSLAYRFNGALSSRAGKPASCANTMEIREKRAPHRAQHRWSIKSKLLEDGGSLHTHDDSYDGTFRFANQSCHGRTTVFIPGRSSHVAGLVSADHSIQVEQIVVLPGYLQVH